MKNLIDFVNCTDLRITYTLFVRADKSWHHASEDWIYSSTKYTNQWNYTEKKQKQLLSQ